MNKLCSLFALLFLTGLFSQGNGSITGKIIDLEMNNEPLLFAEVSVKDTELKARTNLNGNFEILEVVPGAYILVIGNLGYETKEVPIQVDKNAKTIVQEGLGARSLSLADIAELVAEPRDYGSISSSIDGDTP